jgi:hypothetical protein
MKKATTILIICILTLTVIEGSCQKFLISARDEIQISVGYNLALGAEKVGQEYSLLTNMKAVPSADIRYLTSLSKNLKAGIWGGVAMFNDWNAGSEGLYAGTSMRFLSAGGSVMYTPGLSANSKKALNFCIMFSPGISRINVKTAGSSAINGDPTQDALVVRSTRFTMGLHAGLRYVFNDACGATLMAGYQYTPANSKIFPDNSFSWLNVRAGVFYRLFKDKKYKYSGL